MGCSNTKVEDEEQNQENKANKANKENEENLDSQESQESQENEQKSDDNSKESKSGEKKLDEEPKNVDEYNEDVKYCAAFPEKIKGIWEKINNQQANAGLLEENLHQIEDKDFFRIWSCYGVPKILQIKKYMQ